VEGLSKPLILRALEALAVELGSAGYEAPVELVTVGGAALVLLYEARDSTQDVDAFALQPEQQEVVRSAAARVADALELPPDWLNDGAKGYVQGLKRGEVVFESDWLVAYTPPPEQLLAMKLSAWRDDVDISDARLLLRCLDGSKSEIWARVEPFLVPGRELKAQYAFEDLWEVDGGDR
jgi:hypothetical protein